MGNNPPKISEITPEFRKISLKQGFNLSMLDYRHVMITLFLEEDFTKLWLTGSLFLCGFTLVISKWSPSYTPEVDSPIVPCWITFKKLPVMLYFHEALYEVAKMVGCPLRMDKATAHKSVFSKARVCVEVDASAEPLTTVVVQAGGLTHNIDVVYDDFPTYCTYCTKLGHKLENCFKKTLI